METAKDFGNTKRTSRKLKVSLLVLLCGAACIPLYIHVIDPWLWPRQHKRASIRILRAAKTTNDLISSAGRYGVFLSPTNGGWIAIRYVDTHAFKVQSMAIALDSDGRWYESERHFCGSLSFFRRELENVLERQHNDSNWYQDSVASASHSKERMPSEHELLPLYIAQDLESARKQLLAIGFQEFSP